MLFGLSFSALFLLAQAVVTTANPTLGSLQQHKKNLPVYPKRSLSRPTISFAPYHPSKAQIPSPSRNRTCFVQSHNDNVTDDSPYILQAIDDCNCGGHVVFTEGTKYIIGTALNLTYLSHIDLGELDSTQGRSALICFQTFKDISNSPMIPTTGKPIPSNRSFKMRQRFSNLAEKTSMCMEAVLSTETARSGMIYMPRISTSYDRFCSEPLA